MTKKTKLILSQTYFKQQITVSLKKQKKQIDFDQINFHNSSY
jgi:hypothetical protein